MDGRVVIDQVPISIHVRHPVVRDLSSYNRYERDTEAGTAVVGHIGSDATPVRIR
jgi:hypothetical protein